MFRGFVSSLVVGVTLGMAAPLGATPAAVPVVIAVDTSRSLQRSDLAAAEESVVAILRGLPADARVGVLSFNDRPSWVVKAGASPEQALDALGGLALGGRFTVLNDTLFTAAKSLRDGGVILLLTDGRDESSATTVDDVARICTANHVRIVAAATGRNINELALRRLALVTGGTWQGRLTRRNVDGIVTAVGRARAAVKGDLADLTPAPAPTPGALSEAESPAAAEVPSRNIIPSWVPWLFGLAVLLLVAIFFLVRRSRPQLRLCEQCGAELHAWEETCAHCQIAELENAMKTQRVAAPAEPDASTLDPNVFTKKPLPEGLDQTLVLDERPVLVVKQRGRTARTFTLPSDQVFAVGRAPKVNSLQLTDPTVSAQHFKIVPKDGECYVVDLDTTNGTAVNDERIRVRKLRSGDVIRAGAVEFTFKMTFSRMA